MIVFLEDRRVHLVGRVAARVADAADADEADVVAGDGARDLGRVRLLTSSARRHRGDRVRHRSHVWLQREGLLLLTSDSPTVSSAWQTRYSRDARLHDETAAAALRRRREQRAAEAARLRRARLDPPRAVGRLGRSLGLQHESYVPRERRAHLELLHVLDEGSIRREVRHGDVATRRLERDAALRLVQRVHVAVAAAGGGGGVERGGEGEEDDVRAERLERPGDELELAPRRERAALVGGGGAVARAVGVRALLREIIDVLLGSRSAAAIVSPRSARPVTVISVSSVTTANAGVGS